MNVHHSILSLHEVRGVDYLMARALGSRTKVSEILDLEANTNEIIAKVPEVVSVSIHLAEPDGFILLELTPNISRDMCQVIVQVEKLLRQYDIDFVDAVHGNRYLTPNFSIGLETKVVYH